MSLPMLKPSRLLPTSQQATKPVPVPAPNAGINRVDGLSEMGPKDAIFLYNMIPSEFGTRVRTGYREWCLDVGDEGRTVIPFNGSVTLEDRLFVASNDGIYDISVSATSPPPEIVFPIVDDDSGYGQWVNYFNLNSDHFALYTDESNGYYVYTETTNLWTKIAMGGGATQIAGVDPANLVGVTLYASKVWFVERDTADAWYLTTGSLYGTATKFNFGNKFSHGGTLAALYNWTVDGGEGVNDYLVAISTGGDVVVYKGNDPSDADNFKQQGAWFIGPPPLGRRIAGSFGGELYLLSSYGLLPMSKLMSGALVQEQDIYLSRRITPMINNLMIFTRITRGWEVRLVPTENLVVISTPKREGFPYIQFAYSLNTPGWGIYRDFPYVTGDTWHGNFYFTDADGRVLVHTGDLDNVSLDEITSEEIEWSMLMCFLGYGEDGNYHRAQFIRPVFLAEQPPSFNVEARYDYNLSEVFGAPSAVVLTGSLWDVARWDVDLWGGAFVEIEEVRGASGIGRVMSIGLNGNSRAKTILIKFDLLFDTGGLL